MPEPIPMPRLVKLQLVLHVDRRARDDPEYEIVPREKILVEEPFERERDLARGG